MGLSDETRRIAVRAIIVDRDYRQRTELTDLDELASSIQARGLIHPIIIDRDLKLVAGERRLAATIGLGLPDILCRFVDGLSETEKQIIELEENIKRRDLEWKDLVKSMARIHKLYCQLDPDWTMTETAQECNVAISLVSMYLRIDSEFTDPRVAEAGTVNEAYNILKRRDARAAGDALMELIELPSAGPLPEAEPGPYPAPGPGLPVPGAPKPRPQVLPAEQSLLHEDFLKWAPKYEGKKFSFIHCDFPYGIDVFSGPQARGSEPGKGYGDGFNLYMALLESFCKNIDRFMSISSHMMFWYSDKHRDVTRHTFSKLAPSLEIHPYPLIWVKSDNSGIASDPRHGPRHIYETALFITRSKRQIVRIAADAYVAPKDNTLHPSAKPEPMLKHFFSMFVDETSSVFDPTAGSGASLRAGEACGAKHVLGLEINEEFIKPARTALHMARLKRAAERSASRAAGSGREPAR